MLTDGLQFLGSSVAENLSVKAGTALPTSGNQVGRLFYLTTGSTPGLYVYKAEGWTVVGSGAGGGGGTWGSITGTLADQADLNTALNATEKISRRGAAYGYAPLNAGAVIPMEHIGSGTRDGTHFLSGAGTFIQILAATVLDIAFTNLGTVPVGRIFMYVANRAYRLPQNLTGSIGKVGANPTGTRTIAIHRINYQGADTTIGNVVINTAGVVSFTFTGAVDFAVGDILYFQNLVADAAMSDVSITLTAQVI